MGQNLVRGPAWGSGLHPSRGSRRTPIAGRTRADSLQPDPPESLGPPSGRTTNVETRVPKSEGKCKKRGGRRKEVRCERSPHRRLGWARGDTRLPKESLVRGRGEGTQMRPRNRAHERRAAPQAPRPPQLGCRPRAGTVRQGTPIAPLLSVGRSQAELRATADSVISEPWGEQSHPRRAWPRGLSWERSPARSTLLRREAGRGGALPVWPPDSV